MISETTPEGTVTYTYDAAGRRTSITVAGQPIVNYTYDNANRLLQITQGSDTATFAYDAAGRRSSLTLPNGVVVTYNAFKYTGREDDGTGLYYYRARYYYPTLQRFISEDPIGFAGGDVNL